MVPCIFECICGSASLSASVESQITIQTYFENVIMMFLDLIHLIDELSNLRILDIRGAQIKHTHISTSVKSQAFSAEDFCSRLKSPREQVLELRIGGKLIYVYLQNTIDD